MPYFYSVLIPVLFFSIHHFPVLSDIEVVPKVTPQYSRSTFDEKHMNKETHDIEMDHKAVLGSEKEADAFDDLPPEESKKRLRVLATKMDIDKDNSISSEELAAWVLNSLLNLDKEETQERFDEIDSDKDGAITWEEYAHEAFGISPEDEANKVLSDPDDSKLLEEDRRYFAAADLNGDFRLTLEEFGAFQNPEHAEHMHDVLIENTLSDKDANKDGKIDLAEFLGDLSIEKPKSEWYLSEQTRFKNEYDKNKDGVLEGEELRSWLVPDIAHTAKQEAEHLMESADTDKDGKLSIQEVVEAYKIFVGSEATNYGEHLLNISHEEL